MRILGDILLQTLRALLAHKLRSILTMFGVAWGVGSLLLLIGIGEGFRSGQRKQLETLGEDVMLIFAGRVPPAASSTMGTRSYWITYRDHLDIRYEASHVHRVAPVISRGDIRAVSRFQNSNGTVIGTTPDFAIIRYVPMGEGRWLNEEDDLQKRPVAVLGYQMRRNLFPDFSLDPLDEVILLNGVEFQVVGIMENIGRAEDNLNNSRIYLPFRTMQQFFPLRGSSMPYDGVTNLVYQPIERRFHEVARAEVRHIVARNHQFDERTEEAFEDWDTIKSAEAAGKVFDAMNLFLGSVGFTTLALGGIGITNIMLVSVTERTREIGLRKAVGSTRRHILIQFFMEGSVLTLVSGGIGILSAILLTSLLSRWPAPPGFDTPHLVPWATLLSVGCLVVFGVVASLYPARKAAMLDPVEAMRRE